MMGHAYGHSLAERNKDCLRWNYQGQIDTCCMYRRLPARFAARWRDLVPFHPLGAEASDDVELPCSKGGLAGWPARYAFTCLDVACNQAIFRSRL